MNVQKQTDIVVVGSGPGGPTVLTIIALAKRLAAHIEQIKENG